MKKLLLAFAAILCLVSCKKDDLVKDNFAPIYIHGKETRSKERIPLSQLFKMDTLMMTATHDGSWEFFKFFTDKLGNIDRENHRLIMDAGNVIDKEHGGMQEIGGIFLRARNYIIKSDDFGDTLGYIPNSVIRSAQKDILDLWAEGDISTIYERFNESFYFIPCTAEEFKALKEEIDWEHEYDEIRTIHGTTHEIKW